MADNCGIIESMQMASRKEVLLAMSPPFPRRNEGVRRFAREAGWNLIDTSRLVGGLDGLEGWRGDGVIVTLRDDRRTLDFVRRVRRARIPVVDLTIQRPEVKIPRVCLDNVAVGRLAARHFAEFNHRRAIWFSTHWMNVNALRYEGFREEWCSGGAASGRVARQDAAPPAKRVPPERWVVIEDVPAGRRNDFHAVSRWLSDRLESVPKPAAVFCHCIEDASRILSVCGTLAIRVPEEIAVLATGDDREACEMQPVPLSCIPLQGEKHGYAAAALLQKLMDGERPPKSPVLVQPGGIVVRESTDWTAAADPLVAKALALVALNIDHPWGVAQLSAELGVPSQLLCRHFKTELGRTPGMEILRQRLAKARRLLRETGHTLEEVATLCGFCNAPYLSTLFKRETGFSPREWRNAAHPHEVL